MHLMWGAFLDRYGIAIRTGSSLRNAIDATLWGG